MEKVTVVAAVVERDGAFLLTRRLAGTHLEGLWEFPGGKCGAGETHESCLAREMHEELGVDVAVRERIVAIAHEYPERIVHLHFYRCELRGEPAPRLGQQMLWVPRADLRTLDMPPADADLIELLQRA